MHIPQATASDQVAASRAIVAIAPRDSSGHSFVVYSDCCSGEPDQPRAANFAAVNRVVSRIRPRPEFIAFPGDAIVGNTFDRSALLAQWRYFYDTEMKWASEADVLVFQSTSNHHTYDPISEEVFREVHLDRVPQNGPGDQKGMAYCLRRGNLVYISTHQPDRTRGHRINMKMDTGWLDEMLTEHADATYKLVAGHYPVFPINGYTQHPLWCLFPEERRPFWDVLVKHRVNAYLASHVLAFDVQIHDDIPQIVSAGAGTMGDGPLAMMPARTEYLHATQVTLDEQGIRYQVIDTDGKRREALSWPFSLPPIEQWIALNADSVTDALSPARISRGIVGWRFTGICAQSANDDSPQTMICGWDNMEGVATVWIGWEGCPRRLSVRLVPQSGFGWQCWTGPAIEKRFDIQVALHSGMGPGGVMMRARNEGPWTSLFSTSTMGVDALIWPRNWAIGHAQSGPDDWPFGGADLRVSLTCADVADVS